MKLLSRIDGDGSPTILTHTLLYIKNTIKAIKFTAVFYDFSISFYILEIFMEPFGLFSLLQSLINTQTQEKSTPHAPNEGDEQEQQTAPLQIENPNAVSSNTDAFLTFMDTHDRRMHQIKRAKK